MPESGATGPGLTQPWIPRTLHKTGITIDKGWVPIDYCSLKVTMEIVWLFAFEVIERL